MAEAPAPAADKPVTSLPLPAAKVPARCDPAAPGAGGAAAQDTEHEIDAVLARYARALSAQHWAALRLIWPRADFDDFQRLDRPHLKMKLAVRLSECVPALTGAHTATATCKEEITSVDAREIHSVRTRRTTFHLRRIDARWVIDERR